MLCADIIKSSVRSNHLVVMLFKKMSITINPLKKLYQDCIKYISYDFSPQIVSKALDLNKNAKGRVKSL